MNITEFKKCTTILKKYRPELIQDISKIEEVTVEEINTKQTKEEEILKDAISSILHLLK